jgi:DNA invertase Pin-like site-specific DNA recombinase
MRAVELPEAAVSRRAVVYVRQSSSVQVHENLESQRRQYDLAELARRYGFRDVLTIDDDLGRSASGLAARPGFDALIAHLRQGEVGAVSCLEASRLARNGREWVAGAVARPNAHTTVRTGRYTAVHAERARWRC